MHTIQCIENYFNNKLILNNDKNKIINVIRGAVPLIIDHICKTNKSVLILCTDPVMSDHLQRELPVYNAQSNFMPFPDWETLPYDTFSPHDDIVSTRIKTLYQLSNSINAQSITCIPLTTALHRICPPEFIKQQSFYLRVNDKFNLTTIKNELVKYGYSNSTEVHGHGEFCIKGSLIDIYPMGSDSPYRVDLFDDEIDSIRIFDPETQKSIEQVKCIELLPAHEFPFTPEAVKYFRTSWRDSFSGNPLSSEIYNSISENIIPNGIEYFIPLFFDKMATIFDYLSADSTVIILNTSNTHIKNIIGEFLSTAKSRYESYNLDSKNPLLPVDKLFLSEQDFFQQLNGMRTIELEIGKLESNKITKSWYLDLNILAIENIGIDRHLKNPIEKLKKHIENHLDYKYLICCESSGRQEIILELLYKNGLNNIKRIESNNTWLNFLESSIGINIGIAKLDNGFILHDCKIIVISESDLYSNQVQQRRLRKRKDINSEHIIKDLIELKPGQYVVHSQHGIGKYLGLETITVQNITNEYLCLLYQDNSKLYVPVSALNCISRYNGLDHDNIQLNKLGNKSWSQSKNKALKKIQDTAAELLTVYAKRSAKQGFVYKVDEDEYNKFCANFKFEETPDQALAITQVLSDMQKTQSMDRLVCGDVGFGKTEVALRAAFIASMNNKQVAVLVPTTLLAQQHYENFKDRFADFPLNIELLSRFRTSKQSNETIDKIEAGKIDIVIGTHKLLQENIKFKNLGLLIIDEEHRFGVSQKEKIKKLRSNIDILTLTATPIPRTLNLSLTGIRDLSIITTPPQKRLAIKTFLRERNSEVIKEAISRELKRGGQIYYLHNNVKTIDQVHKEITELFPNAKTAVAHGQMRERDLEKIMSDFYHRKHHILICTTIIETGIDIPSANTILIDRADKLGLAQLHQIRGRVGRSHHQAYAYLFTPRDAKITSDAQKRLEAICSLENLGAGFTLASHDMEIRGTGNLLGEEQSGHIEAIGYSLYMELLNKAINALKNGEILDINQIDMKNCEVDLKVSALLPDDYIQDIHQRLVTYKRIASAKNDHELEGLKLEIRDRFGKIPDYVDNLFLVNSIKLKAEKLKIIKIDIGSQSGKIKFDEKPIINQAELINLIQRENKNYKLSANDTLSFFFPMEKVIEKYNTITNILNKLAP